ncbi:MAG: sulfatase-like hydrolase/transferase [Acidobacteria bacterium]|nr:sulfatase-like hydrolase/transferase [Acidobacteriota bacterium]
MNRSSNSGPVLPGWARAADGLTVVFALMAAYVTVFGGIRIGDLFSMSTPWRALVGLTIICGLRHFLVRTSPLHERVLHARAWSWLSAAAPWLRPAQQRVGSWLRSVAPRPREVPPETASERRLQALHIVGLWCLAVAQPIFDVVGRSPEFFIAHDTRPGDLLGLVAVVCLGGPAACLLLVRLAGLAGGPRWRRRIATGVIAGLAATVALAALKPFSGADGGYLVALAALAGAGAAVVYRGFAPARLFATFLAPATLVVPALFLFTPGVGRLLSPAGEVAALDGVTFAATPPVVVVVFDQFQLAALLDRDGNIDRAAFPNFAALADDATWFRNATAAAGLTTYALPAVLTGMRPSEGLLPIAAEHPANLFTLLGGRYRLHVEEPLTDLCPEALCPPERPPWSAWFGGVMGDLAVVYLAVVLPDDLAAALPPVDQNWKDFAASEDSETFGDRWRTARLDDRRVTIDRFIAAIDADTRPVLHFMHALLPHEPFLYLPTGQQFTFQRHMIGLREGRWNEDRWAAALNYHRYLLQVAYVDTLLSRLMARLREVGIYDDALIVVTADHGLSLQPGQSIRQPTESSFADVAGVPLFVKRPAQRRGNVVDANVEVIDIVPTLAAELGVDLPWSPDGSNVLDPAHSPRPSKVMFYDGARRHMEVPGDLNAALIESAARKFEWLDTGELLDIPTPDRRYGDLIGSPAVPAPLAQPGDFEVIVDALPLMRDMDPQADFVPAHITGHVVGLSDGAPPPVLAIALNGQVAAVTRPYAFPVVGRREAWEAIINPRWLVPGDNSLQVFEVREDSGSGAISLAATRGDAATSGSPNLIRDEQLQRLGGRVSGFYGTEWAGARPFRWTRGDARLVVPLDPETLPTSLAVEVLITGGPKQLNISIDGCTLFEQTISGRWSATFDLGDCRLEPPELEITLLSDTHVPSTRDTRALGVAVGRVELRGEVPSP